MITLFSTGCPKCRILKQKLDAAHIDYVVAQDLSELYEKGFMTVPILKIDNKYLEFSDAIKWVNGR